VLGNSNGFGWESSLMSPGTGCFSDSVVAGLVLGKLEVL